MNARVLVGVGVVLGSLVVAPAAVYSATPRKQHRVVRQEPLGEYKRCEEDCPPPGLIAEPPEVWCANRAQCTSLSGCSCRLFRRQQGTRAFAYVVEAPVHVPREPGYGYVCWCTKPKGP